MIYGYINIARKLSKEYDIVLAKELFSSFVLKGYDIHLLVSLGNDLITFIPSSNHKLHTFDKQIIHCFKQKNLRLNLYVY